MAAFVDGQEHFTRLSQQQTEESNHAYTRSGRILKGRDIDLGPLVGSTRGFRTKEKVPMGGGLGGMEMDRDEEVPVVHVSVQSLTPQRRSTKGKEKALESDVDMLVDDEERRGRSREIIGLCCFLLCLHISLFFIFSFRMDAHFLPLGTQNASKSPLNSTYIPPSPASPPHPT
jgi:hypothetical protein